MGSSACSSVQQQSVIQQNSEQSSVVPSFKMPIDNLYVHHQQKNFRSSASQTLTRKLKCLKLSESRAEIKQIRLRNEDYFPVDKSLKSSLVSQVDETVSFGKHKSTSKRTIIFNPVSTHNFTQKLKNQREAHFQILFQDQSSLKQSQLMSRESIDYQQNKNSMIIPIESFIDQSLEGVKEIPDYEHFEPKEYTVNAATTALPSHGLMTRQANNEYMFSRTESFLPNGQVEVVGKRKPNMFNSQHPQHNSLAKPGLFYTKQENKTKISATENQFQLQRRFLNEPSQKTKLTRSSSFLGTEKFGSDWNRMLQHNRNFPSYEKTIMKALRPKETGPQNIQNHITSSSRSSKDRKLILF